MDLAPELTNGSEQSRIPTSLVFYLEQGEVEICFLISSAVSGYETLLYTESLFAISSNQVTFLPVFIRTFALGFPTTIFCKSSRWRPVPLNPHEKLSPSACQLQMMVSSSGDAHIFWRGEWERRIAEHSNRFYVRQRDKRLGGVRQTRLRQHFAPRASHHE